MSSFQVNGGPGFNTPDICVNRDADVLKEGHPEALHPTRSMQCFVDKCATVVMCKTIGAYVWLG